MLSLSSVTTENIFSPLTERFTITQSIVPSFHRTSSKPTPTARLSLLWCVYNRPFDLLPPLIRGSQYKKYGKQLCNVLDGMFSFVLLDESATPTRIIAARDPIGITTLYQGRVSSKPGVVIFASELKALPAECDEIISFPPGHVYDSQTDTIERYYNPSWWDSDQDDKIPTSPANLEKLRTTLEYSVKKRLMSEVPYGVLLSGGLDSSLIAAIASRETDKVAQAQAEARKKKLAQASSGPVTPNPDATSEYGATISIFNVVPLLTGVTAVF